MTVADVIRTSCTTEGLSGLSHQLIGETMTLAPGVLVPITAIPGIQPTHPNVHLVMQRACHASLTRVVQARSPAILHVNSCFRPLPEQLAEWTRKQEGRCGITAAANPGSAAPHSLGTALDVEDALAWEEAFTSHGWRYLGPGDRMHFDRMTNITTTLVATGIRAFQILANRHGIHVAIDGQWGPSTQAALLSSPSSGWTT